MQRFLKNMLIFLFVLLLFPVVESNAELFDLYTGEVKGAYRDLTVTKVEDKYFLHKEDLLPGDVIRGEYLITNASSKSYDLTLKSLINEESPTSAIMKDNKEVVDEWIKDINLKLTLDGEVIYDGLATGEDNFEDTSSSDKNKKFTDGIYIGKIYKSTQKKLEAEFTIPEKLDNEYQEAWARVDWIFEAKWSTGGNKPSPSPSSSSSPNPSSSSSPRPSSSSNTNPSSNPGLDEEEPPLPAAGEIEEEPFETPDTGDEIADIILYGVITLGALAGIILIIFSKKKES